MNVESDTQGRRAAEPVEPSVQRRFKERAEKSYTNVSKHEIIKYR